MVKDALIDLTLGLLKHPEKLPLNHFKKITTVAGELLRNIIIVYPITFFEEQIRIVRLRHTSKSPLIY